MLKKESYEEFKNISRSCEIELSSSSHLSNVQKLENSIKYLLLTFYIKLSASQVKNGKNHRKVLKINENCR